MIFLDHGKILYSKQTFAQSVDEWVEYKDLKMVQIIQTHGVQYVSL